MTAAGRENTSWTDKGKGETARRFRPYSLDGLQVLGSRFAGLAIHYDFERDTLALTQLAQAGALDSTDVDKHILAAALRLNESITLLRVEPFNGSVAHGNTPLQESRFEPRNVHGPVRSRFW
jgi:hypothetical protein